MIRALFLSLILAAVGCVVGIFLWGNVAGEGVTLGKLTSVPADELVSLLRHQPSAVHVSTLVGLLIGFFFAILSSKKKKASSVEEPDLRSRPRQTGRSQDTGILPSTSDRHPLLSLLGALTLGVLRFYAVPQGYALVVTAFGKFRKAVNPGFSSILSLWGLYHRPWGLVSVKEQIKTYPEEVIFTSDGVKCRIDVTIYYKVVDPQRAVFEVEDLLGAVENVVRAVLRNECGKLPARSLLASREMMAQSLRETLGKDADPWGISVRLVEITEVDISVQDKKD